MSSDTHTIEPLEGDQTNYIGFRSTWIKMSKPSIESLRQAFLDHESRVKISPTRPEEKFHYPIIKKIKINNAKFLKSEPITFSPNLNCIIGGRGTGKSTTLDYIRLVLDQVSGEDIPADLKTKLEEKYKNTLKPDSQIILEFNKSGVDYQVKYEHGNQSRSIIRLDGSEIPEDLKINELFPMRILSQGEIDKRIDSANKNSLLKIFDNFLLSELTRLEREEESILKKLKQLDLEIDNISKDLRSIPSVQTKIADLKEQVKRLESIQPDIERWELYNNHNDVIQDLIKYPINLKRDLKTITDKLQDLPIVPQERLEHSDDFDRIFDIIKNARETLIKNINLSIDSFLSEDSQENKELKGSLDRWYERYDIEKENYQHVKIKLQNKGDDPDKYLQLKKELASVEKELISLNEEQTKLDTLSDERREYLINLREIWDNRTEVRRKKATELMKNLCPKKSHQPLLKITFLPQADISQIKNEWISHLTDRRSLNVKDIEDYVVGIKRYWDENSSLHNSSLHAFLLSTLTDNEYIEKKREILGNRLQKFNSIFIESTIRQLEIARIDDEVKFDVYRIDGSLAGSIDRVSAGQKGLAIIHLLLASGEEPLIIDTPEEGLDNEGVFSELVPLFRAEKEKRQIILVTHNANLPVNGDSELIITFDTIGSIDENIQKEIAGKLKDHPGVDSEHVIRLIQSKKWDSEIGHYLVKNRIDQEQLKSIRDLIYNSRAVYGQIKQWKQEPTSPTEYCLGALDNDSVKMAVQSIMEGSEYAFRQRLEKYGF